MKKSLKSFLKSAKQHSGEFVGGIPIAYNSFFYNFVITRYTPKLFWNSNNKL